MTEFISKMFTLADASGAATDGTQTDIWGSLLSLAIPLVLIVAFFYFFLLRPQKKQDKQVAAMRDGVALGDVIITTGGIVARVIRIKDDMLLVETGGGKTRLQIERKSVREIKNKAISEE